jgi:hypothetical protein
MPRKKKAAGKKVAPQRKRMVPKKAARKVEPILTGQREGQDDSPAALALDPEEHASAIRKLKKLLLSYSKHKAVAKREGESADVQKDIIKGEMTRLGINELTAEEKDPSGAVHKVKANLGDPPMTLVYDEAKLKKALGVTLWNKVSTRRLDERKLKAFIKSGEVDAIVVAQCSNEEPGTPRLTYNESIG